MDHEPRLESGADRPVCRFAGCQRCQPAGRSQGANLEFYSTLRRLAVGDTAGWQPALRVGSWEALSALRPCIGTVNQSGPIRVAYATRILQAVSLVHGKPVRLS